MASYLTHHCVLVEMFASAVVLRPIETMHIDSHIICLAPISASPSLSLSPRLSRSGAHHWTLRYALCHLGLPSGPREDARGV